MTLAEQILHGDKGAKIPVRDGRGLYVGYPGEETRCPEGWIFIDKLTATTEMVQRSLRLLSLGSR